LGFSSTAGPEGPQPSCGRPFVRAGPHAAMDFRRPNRPVRRSERTLRIESAPPCSRHRLLSRARPTRSRRCSTKRHQARLGFSDFVGLANDRLCEIAVLCCNVAARKLITPNGSMATRWRSTVLALRSRAARRRDAGNRPPSVPEPELFRNAPPVIPLWRVDSSRALIGEASPFWTSAASADGRSARPSYVAPFPISSTYAAERQRPRSVAGLGQVPTPRCPFPRLRSFSAPSTNPTRKTRMMRALDAPLLVGISPLQEARTSLSGHLNRLPSRPSAGDESRKPRPDRRPRPVGVAFIGGTSLTSMALWSPVFPRKHAFSPPGLRS